MQTNLERLRDALKSCDYPVSLFKGHLPEHALETLVAQLEARSDALFCKDPQIAVRVFELESDSGGYLTHFLSAEIVR